MKNFYVLLLLLSGLSGALLNAQTCTPDPQYANSPGIYPTAQQGFSSGTVGLAYSQNITITVPQDTTIGTPPFTTTLNFDSAHLVSMQNLPPGLTYMCSPGICTWNGGTSGCSAIYGTPTTAGTYPLTINVNAYVGGSTSPVSQTITDYTITINAAVGISENTASNFEVKQNLPNPVAGKTMIRYSVPADDKVKICVYNMLGKLVTEKKADAVKGENECEIDARAFPGGMYFYTVEYKGKTVTRRMLVSNY